MQFSSLALFIVAAAGSGVLATPPARRPPPPPPPPPSNKINNINGNNAQSISCGNGAQPYCCSASSTDGDNNSQYKCVDLKGSCDAIAVCCNNNNNGQTNSAKQYCSAFGNAKVIFV